MQEKQLMGVFVAIWEIWKLEQHTLLDKAADLLSRHVHFEENFQHNKRLHTILKGAVNKHYDRKSTSAGTAQQTEKEKCTCSDFHITNLPFKKTLDNIYKSDILEKHHDDTNAVNIDIEKPK